MIEPRNPVPRVAAADRRVLDVIRSPGWMRDALCRETGGDLFFERDTVHLARKICGMCPVQGPCAAYGSGEEFGVWGGVTANQRDTSKVRTTCLAGHRKQDGGTVCQVCADQSDDPADLEEDVA